MFVFVLQYVRYLVLWSGRSWLAGMEEGSHCRVLERPGSRPSWWSEAGYRDKPTWGMRTKSSLEGRTIFKECSKRLSVSSPGHRGQQGVRD